MEMKTYGKKDILDLVIKYGELEYELDSTTLEKRLDDTIKFINKDQVRAALSFTGGFFYEKEMDVTRAKGNQYTSYNYNLIDAIFLGVLVSLYNQSFFKKLRNQSNIENLELEAMEWESAFSERVYAFKPIWNEREYQKPTWDIVTVNLAHLFYQFTLIADASKHANEIQDEVHRFVDLFDGLPEEHQITFYNKAMKNRITYMKLEIEKYIEGIKETDPEGYATYKFHKKLVEIDKEFN